MRIETFTKDEDAQVYLTREDINIIYNALFLYQKDQNYKVKHLYSDWIVLTDLVREGGMVTDFTIERVCELRGLCKLVKRQEQQKEIISTTEKTNEDN